MLHLPRAPLIAASLLCCIGTLHATAARSYDAPSLASADANYLLLDVVADRLDNAAGRDAAWGLALSADHDRRGDASRAHYRHDMRGISAGYDALSGRIWRFGIAAARVSHDPDASAALAATDLGQVALAAYTGGVLGRVSVSGGVMLSRWQDTARDVGTAIDADANARAAFLAVAYDLGTQNDWRARVEARISRIDASGEDFQRAGAGLAFIRPLKLRNGGSVTPWLRTGLQWQKDARDITRAYAGAGVSWEPTARTAFTLSYEAQQADSVQGRVAQIGFSVAH